MIDFKITMEDKSEIERDLQLLTNFVSLQLRPNSFIGKKVIALIQEVSSGLNSGDDVEKVRVKLKHPIFSLTGFCCEE